MWLMCDALMNFVEWQCSDSQRELLKMLPNFRTVDSAKTMIQARAA